MLRDLYNEKRNPCTQRELDVVIGGHRRYLSKKGGARARFVSVTLDGLRLAGHELSDADFAGASLIGANLARAKLERASFYCADMRKADLRHANLRYADMRGVSFRGANLSFALLDNADLRAGMMMQMMGGGGVSVIDHGDLSEQSAGAVGGERGVDFSNCSMKGISFANANLKGVNFNGALLNGANFRGAKLADVSFVGAVISGVRDLAVPPGALKGAILDAPEATGATLEALRPKLDAHQQWIASGGTQGCPAVLDDMDLRPMARHFVGRQWTGLSARHAIAIGVDFSGCQLQGAKFDGADIRDANFVRADLRGASFRGANIAHADFTNADIRILRLVNGNARATDFSESQQSDNQLATALVDEAA
jgi:uncharacterized protein YjbI with pentapeptide repeats